jgi:DNA-binding IclR family transcriptional regulator
MTNERALAIALRNGLVALTEKTITTLDGLLAELDRVREAGFATHDGEADEGIRAVACAIGQERFGAVVGTVAVSAPSSRVSPEQMAELAPAVQRCARDIEAVWPADAAQLVERAG